MLAMSTKSLGLTFCFATTVAQDVFLKAKSDRPNIVWIMADDLGWGEVGLYPSTSENGRISTPHLDKFGREGVQFMQAYAGYTVCSPSRTTFFTGRHSGQFAKHGLNGHQIPPNQVTTLADMLQDAGYATGAFGKTAPLGSPQKVGFDFFFGQVHEAECHNMYAKQIDQGLGTGNVNLTLNWKDKSRELCLANPELYNYTVDAFHDAGVAWLQDVAVGDKPFFMYMSYTVPHAGGWTDDNAEQGNPVPTTFSYDNSSWPEVERDHAAVVTYLDAKVGNLMRWLTHLGVDDNTLVFFASDNGAHHEGGHKNEFFNSTGGLKGQKRSLYEGGVRSPTMARWPAKIQAGRVSHFPWAFWDVMPTFAELAGASAPEGLDGISIAPELTGEGQQEEHEYLYWTWKEDESTGYAVRVGDWKGVVPSCTDVSNIQPSLDDEMFLFDVVNDPFEKQDLSTAQAHQIKLLKDLVIAKNLSCQCYGCR